VPRAEMAPMARERPAPERGETLAAGAVALTVLVYVLNARFDAEWGQGIHLIYTAAAALFVLSLAGRSPRPAEGERPAAWQSILFIATFALWLRALVDLADVLGADDAFDSSGTIVWIGLLLTGLMVRFARRWDSGISTLITAIVFGGVIVAFVDWVFSPDSATTFRWVLVAIAVGYFLVGRGRRSAAPHHAVGFVNAAGVAIFAIAATFVGAAPILFGVGAAGDLGFGSPAGWGWELVVLVGAGALIAYAAAEGKAGPGYLGALNLLAFLSLAAGAGEDGPSLIGWPLVLILVTLGLFFAAMSRGYSPEFDWQNRKT
jgi:hypothetical protein